jgi:branched-chain amino acid transport system permease protein
MHYCGDFRTSYEKDMEILQTPATKLCVAAFLAFLLVLPFLVKGEYLWISMQIVIAVVGAVGLNILTGFTGQISLGQGAFLGVGAYTSAFVTAKMGLPFWVGVPAAGIVTAVAGMLFGIPSLRLKGLYLAIATLASQFILEWVFLRWEPVTGGSYGIVVPRPSVGGYVFESDRSYFYVVLVIAVLMVLFAVNLVRTRTGRAFMSVRDHYISAEVMGINLFKYRILSFAVSSFYAGVAGALYGHSLKFVSSEQFGIGVSVTYLAMIIIGGLGSILGSIYGAVFMILLPQVITVLTNWLGASYPNIEQVVIALEQGIFGAIIILFLIFEPDGLAHRWKMIKTYWKLTRFPIDSTGKIILEVAVMKKSVRVLAVAACMMWRRSPSCRRRTSRWGHLADPDGTDGDVGKPYAEGVAGLQGIRQRPWRESTKEDRHADVRHAYDKNKAINRTRSTRKRRWSRSQGWGTGDTEALVGS